MTEGRIVRKYAFLAADPQASRRTIEHISAMAPTLSGRYTRG